MPRFTYIYNIEYHFTQINEKRKSDDKSTSKENKIDLEELCSVFKESYPNSLLCVLLMNEEDSDANVAGTFYVYLNTNETKD